MAKIENNSEKSWLRRIPFRDIYYTRSADSIELSQATIYIHAIYWSVVTFSGIGIGDVVAITVPERAFN